MAYEGTLIKAYLPVYTCKFHSCAEGRVGNFYILNSFDYILSADSRL